MNTNQAYEEYFGAVVAAMELKVPDALQYTQRAIQSGLQRFWGASKWSFKGGTYKLVISAASDSYDLPDNFDSMITLREETSNKGLKLSFMEKEAFDAFVPKQSAWSSNNPYHYTIFYEENGKRVISVYPRPSSTTLYLHYLKTTPADVTRVPDKFQGGVESAISMSIFLPGKSSRKVAYNEFREEVKRLEVQDKQDMSKYLKYKTEADIPYYNDLPWWCY